METKHKAKRIEAGEYLYRGYRISLVDDCGYKAWNIFAPNQDHADDAADTLTDAKYLVDQAKK